MSARGANAIRVLSPELANQIAAGEVVERPASVVKELVENALDAGAMRIFVDIEAGGRRLVRVSDDGTGMTPADAELCLIRHATSKLTSLDELQGLTTMGFRGEALPAIASVARFALITRTADAVAGFRVEVEAGVRGEMREVGAPPGTQVEVRDLFYNVPARQKFMKTEATEGGQVADALLRLAIANPAVHLRLKHGGRTTMDALPAPGLPERVRSLLGPGLGARLWEVEPRPDAPVRVQAFLAPPDESLATARGVLLYVGRRPVRDRGLLHAVTSAYEGLLPQGRYPQAVVLVDVDPGEVDINVHPQKAEVRFARPGDVYGAVRHALLGGIADAGWAEGNLAEASPQRALPLPLGERGLDHLNLPMAMTLVPTQLGLPPDATFLSQLTYVGPLEDTFVVCGAPNELVLIDLHGARELVAERRLMLALSAGKLRPQRLLFPARVTVGAAEASAAYAARDALSAIGFEFAVAGADSLSVRAIPSEVPGDPARLLPSVLAALSRVSALGAPRPHDLLGPLACELATAAEARARGAIAAIGRSEARTLLEALDGVDLARRPHGRPVLVRLPLDELLRRFAR